MNWNLETWLMFVMAVFSPVLATILIVRLLKGKD